MIRRAYVASLLVSLILHGGLLLILTLPRKSPPKFKISQQHKVSIEIIESNSSNHKGTEKPNKVISKTSQTKSLERFNPTTGFYVSEMPSGQQSISKNTQHNYDTYSKMGAAGEMNAMGLEELVQRQPFYTALWQRVNVNIDYPDDFILQRLKGKVSLHIEVNRKGEFVGDILSFETDDDMLGAYVAAKLIQALKRPLVKKVWLKEDRLYPVALNFHFNYYSITKAQPKDLSFSHKNALFFERRGYVDPKAVQAFKKFFTRYVPPIIPIPGGFYIEFALAYEYIKNIGTPDPDVLRVERLRLLKENLEATIKKATPR